jgi:hypothetical protein
MTQAVLDAARQRRDEIEIALYMDSPEPWERDILELDLSRQLHIIDEAEVMLGYKHWVGYTGRRSTLWERLVRWWRRRLR